MGTRQINIDKLLEDIQAATKSSHNEEELKMQLEPIFKNVFKKIGVNIENVRYEKTSTIVSGRQDAVYGFLTIEYKRHSKLSQTQEVTKVINQLKKYLENEAMQFGSQKDEFLEKAIGVAIDGESILFIRFSKKAIIPQTPIPIELEQKGLFPQLEIKQGFLCSWPFPYFKIKY